MRIRITLLIGITILSLSACNTAEQETAKLLQKGSSALLNKMQPPSLCLPQAIPIVSNTVNEPDPSPRNFWEAAELARTW